MENLSKREKVALKIYCSDVFRYPTGHITMEEAYKLADDFIRMGEMQEKFWGKGVLSKIREKEEKIDISDIPF